jgi:HAD domain in Swiss Army Knife RNA repair proteins
LNEKASQSSTYCVPKHLPTEPLVTNETNKPILFVDVDGVISLFGFAPGTGQLPGPLHWVDGVAHCIPEDVGQRLVTLAESFELVWATGWEERANEHLPFLLKLPFRDLPCLTFDGRAVFGSAHWKVDAVDEYAAGRPAAWVDDNLGEECHAWAEGRSDPTLLVETSPSVGLTDEHVSMLLDWAENLAQPGISRGPGA